MVYVDDLIIWSAKFGPSCHMMTDGDLSELHAMADQIGLSRRYFQNKPRHPHYDLKPNKRALAIKHGAVSVSGVEMLKRCVIAS